MAYYIPGTGLTSAGVPVPYSSTSLSAGATAVPPPPTMPSTPALPSINPLQSQFLPMLQNVYSGIQSLMSGGLKAPDANTQGYLDSIASAEQGAVNLQGQANRDQLAGQLYSQFGQQTPSGSSPTTGLADQVGARFEYGQDQLNRQVQADAAQRALDVVKFLFSGQLQGLGMQGTVAAAGAGQEGQNWSNYNNQLLNLGGLANQQYGQQSQNALGLYGQQSQNALQQQQINQGYFSQLFPFLTSMLTGGLGALGGASGSGGSAYGGGSGTPYSGMGMMPGGIGQSAGYGTGSYDSFGQWIPSSVTNQQQISNLQQNNQIQLLQALLPMLMQLFGRIA